MDGIPAVLNVQLRLQKLSWMEHSFHPIGPPHENHKVPLHVNQSSQTHVRMTSFSG